jgi:DNA-binding FadR family transcriptional regulator
MRSAEAPLRRTKTSVLVAHKLARRAARLEPGEMLPPEHVLLDELQVGRGTLREALRLLELQGIITMKAGPRGGPVVARPDHGPLADTLALALQAVGVTFSEVIEARLAFEPNLARLAGEKIGEAGEEAPELLALRQALSELSDSLDDEQEFLEANLRFHEALAACSYNRPLELFHLCLVKISDGHALGVTYSAAQRKAILEAHGVLTELIAAGKSEAAEEQMGKNINDFATHLRKRHRDLLDRRVEWILD